MNLLVQFSHWFDKEDVRAAFRVIELIRLSINGRF